MPITLRNTKGSELTFAELDGNFSDLDGRVQTLESAADSDNQTISLNGSNLTITGGNTIDISSAFNTFGDNPPVSGQNILGSLIPDSDEAYDLGSSAFKFRDLYLSGTTLYLGTGQLSFDPGLGASGEWNFGRPINAEVKVAAGNGFGLNDNFVVNQAYLEAGYHNDTSNPKGGLVFNAAPTDGSGISVVTVDQAMQWEARLDGVVRIVGSGGYRTARVANNQLASLATDTTTDLADANKVVGGAINVETDGANGLWVYDRDNHENNFYIDGQWKRMIPIEELQDALPAAGSGSTVDDIINAINNI